MFDPDYINNPTPEERDRWISLFNAIRGIPDHNADEFRGLRQWMATMDVEDRIAEAMAHVDLDGDADVTPSEMAEIAEKLGGNHPAARLVNVQAGTIRKWASGEFKINQQKAKVLRFLARDPDSLPKMRGGSRMART
jgi:DNA-binding transcriptional regulator YiaG